MNLQTLYDAARPRHRVWCVSDDLTEGESAGTYVFSDETMAGKLGDGSEIIVMDTSQLLFWDAGEQVAYEWGGGA